jgi:hypothetical protein
MLIDLLHDGLPPTKARGATAHTVHCRCGERQRPTEGHLEYAVSASRICELPKLRLDSRIRGLPRTALFLCDLGRRFLSLPGLKQLEPLFRVPLRIGYNLEAFDFTHFCTSSITMLMKLTTVSYARAAESSGFVK